MSEGKVMEGESSVGDGEGPGVVFRKRNGGREGGGIGRRGKGLTAGEGKGEKGRERVKCLKG